MTQNPLLLALVPAVFIATSCATSPHEPNETYILVTANTKIPYWQDALAGLNRAGAELKVKVRMTGPETYDPKAERDAFLNAVQQKPTGILISVTDASLLSTDIDNALHQEVPVITIDADAPDSGRLLFIGYCGWADPLTHRPLQNPGHIRLHGCLAGHVPALAHVSNCL